MESPAELQADVSEPSIESAFHTFTIPQVLSVVGDFVRLPRAAKRSRKELFATLTDCSAATLRNIRAAALDRSGTKRKAGTSDPVARKRARVTAEPPDEPDVDVDMDILDGPFFRPPVAEQLEAGIARMIDRTGNAALAKQVCMVCARKLFARFLVEMQVKDIPNSRRLVPRRSHPAHDLYAGMLLHADAVDVAQTFICLDCKRKLVLDEVPPLSLANGMWLGRVPFQLAILTLPERLLIALYFPAAYVVKLWPKKAGAQQWDRRSVNSGLKGNVSTYRLNTAEIAGIVSGTTMPPSPRILAATIGVTFVGAGNRPLGVLPDFFRVRRQRVFEALLWLQSNNDLYRDINISPEQLKLLPENGVPLEILENARYTNDIAALEREQAGYVPPDPADRPSAAAGDAERILTEDPAENEEIDDETYDPGVFPLQAHGVVDVQADSVPDNDVRAHAFANMTSRRVKDDFLIRKGSAFINEYPRLDEQGHRFDGGPGNPNHMLGAYPVLFPYGKGGLEVERDADVPYESHVRWALQYSDGRFRKHLHFIFQAFGVIQKREVCRSAAIQIKRSAFVANTVSFLKLGPKDFLQASAEETRKVPFSNPVIRALRKQLTSLRARVPGTDESRISIRGQVWGMNLMFNPPSIWVTLNLADTSDPVAQVLAGAEIDLDRFVETAGPDRAARAIAIARDPFAAAEFFHVTISTIIEELFGMTANRKGKPLREEGIVGFVNGYIGTVEAQARGTLHLHILFWLRGAPTAEGMRRALQSDAFRRKVTAFLKETIRADIRGTTAETVLQIPSKSAVSYSRPEDPRLPNYATRRNAAEATIARVVQVHGCTPNACQKIRNGRVICKRRAPWQLASEDWILPTGDWGPRRVFAYMNPWNPSLLQVTRANHDIKIVTNGQDTKDITFYITMYIAKKQNQASNASALLAKSFAFRAQNTVDGANAREINKRMIQQCANTLSREQELSGPEVVSYLMGWDDRFISHNFAVIYWDEVTSALRRRFPGLEQKSVLSRTAEQLGQGRPTEATDTTHDPTVRIQVEDGVFVLKDQLKEYTDRAEALENMSYFEYHVETYDAKPLKTTAGAESEEQDVGDDRPRRPGRPSGKRFPYLDSAKRKGCRMIRAQQLETMPHFIGRWFPRKDSGEYYCANLLALLKPWRDLGDLQAEDGTFRTAFDAFMQGASLSVKRIVANVNYFHECSDGARIPRGAPSEILTGGIALNDEIRRAMETEAGAEEDCELTEADVDAARNTAYAARDYVYGIGAMNVAHGLGIFDPNPGIRANAPLAAKATFEETLMYAEWGAKLKGMTRRAELVVVNTVDNPGAEACVTAGPATELAPGVVADRTALPIMMRSAAQQASLDLLNKEQRRAHDIIENHLVRTLTDVRQPQLLMMVRGEGGTGKTVLLNALADTFEFHEASAMLAKTATTGVAASLVGGQTVHGWAVLPVRAADTPMCADRAPPVTIEKRKTNILPVKYLNIDECSMLTKQLLAQLSQVVGQVKASDGDGDPSRPFGGTNVILIGDFHQFPPVGDPSAALYCPRNSRTQAEVGLAIYQQFTTVVTLVEQKRIVDHRWRELLQRLRVGGCNEEDMDILKSLLVSDPQCQLPEWDVSPWDNAVLVTPRHAVRIKWNSAALQKHCYHTGNRLYICHAEDTMGRNEEGLDLRKRVIVAAMPVKKTAKLGERVELAIGMRAMVLMNIATEADLANGTRGVVVDIRLDAREPTEFETDADTGGTFLKYPPALILFKPDSSTYPAFEGLPPGILPIVPSKAGFAVQDRGHSTKIKRRQLAMTAAYAFTDYKSQGQSLGCVFVDLEKPPSGKLTPFSAYVALSRSRGRDSIRLLRGFDPTLFTTHPSEDLELEDRRLDELTRRTTLLHA